MARDAKYLKELFDYREETGELINKVTRGSRAVAGCVAGAESSRGYRAVRIHNERFYLHTVIFAWHTGHFPEEHLDHINGIRHDNRIENLREVTRKENQRNMQRSTKNTSGVIGVSRFGANRWRARINTDSGETHLGYFDKFDDAVACRKKAEKDNGYHENHGRDT